MDSATFAAEAAVEAGHWWFVGRRTLFSRIIERLGLPRDAAVLDVGTSTGTNLRMLRGLGFSRVTGLDQSPEAVRFCAEKGFGDVQLGDVCALPFPDQCFDLVLATDIVEHVPADLAAMRELRRVLKPRGYLLLTVPTFRLLWGLQDDVAHHQRRYRMPELLGKLRTAGLNPQQHFYFNYLLFLPILIARRLMRLLRVRVASENNLNPGWLNRILLPLFLFDIRTANWLKPPVGVSALVVAAPSAATGRDASH
jgi:SAM-dependent methyltransferase